MSDEQIKFPEGPDVYWQKWEDPLQEELDSDAIEDDEEWEDDGGPFPFIKAEKPVKALMTPYGVLPLTNHVLASTRFKLWEGHTNFKLGQRHLQAIESCNGVEAVNIDTPYRFKIAVGKLFRDRDVMNCVRTVLVSLEQQNVSQ